MLSMKKGGQRQASELEVQQQDIKSTVLKRNKTANKKARRRASATSLQSNKAYSHFIGESSEYDQRQFDVWYSDKSLLYLLQGRAKIQQGNMLPYVFIEQAKDEDTKGADCSFATQLEQLAILKNHRQQDICFIATEPGEMAVSHFICGIFAANKLLIINPMGLSQHKDFYQALEVLQNKYQFTIYLSTNELQQDKKGIVSCGPICAELALNFLLNTATQCFDRLKEIEHSEESKEGKEGEEKHAVSYTRVDITNLLPLSLQTLSLDTYEQQITAIRMDHSNLLHSIVKDASFWDACENSNIQVLMRLLCIEKKSILHIQETPEYRRLQTAKQRSKGEVIQESESESESTDSDTETKVPPTYRKTRDLFGKVEEKGKERVKTNTISKKNEPTSSTESEEDTASEVEETHTDPQHRESFDENSTSDLERQASKDKSLLKHAGYLSFFRGWDVQSAWNALTTAGISLPIIPALIAAFYSKTAPSILATSALMSAVLNITPGHYQVWKRIKKLEQENQSLVEKVKVKRQTSLATRPVVNHVGLGVLLIADVISLAALVVQAVLYNVSQNKDDIQDKEIEASVANNALALALLVIAHPTIGVWMITTQKNLEQENKDLNALKLHQIHALEKSKRLKENLTILKSQVSLLTKVKFAKAVDVLVNKLEVMQQILKDNTKHSCVKWLKKLEVVNKNLKKLERESLPLSQKIYTAIRSQTSEEREVAQKRIEALEHRLTNKGKDLSRQFESLQKLAGIALSEKITHSAEYPVKFVVNSQKKRSFHVEINATHAMSMEKIQKLFEGIKDILSTAFPKVTIKEEREKGETIPYLKLSAKKSHFIKAVLKFLESAGTTTQIQAGEEVILPRTSSPLRAAGLFAPKPIIRLTLQAKSESPAVSPQTSKPEQSSTIPAVLSLRKDGK